MSVGPPENYEHMTDPSDAAEPTRPSERGAWRNHWDDEDDDETDDQLARRPGISATQNEAFRHHHKP